MTGRNSVPSWFGKRVARERKARGWSLRALGDRCGLAGSGVLRIENGADPQLSSVIALAAALDLTVADLIAVPVCATCDGEPPEGYLCGECGRGQSKISATRESAS